MMQPGTKTEMIFHLVSHAIHDLNDAKKLSTLKESRHHYEAEITSVLDQCKQLKSKLSVELDAVYHFKTP